MSLTVEGAHEIIIGSESILSDRGPQFIAAFRILQSCTICVDDIVVERDVIGKNEILVLVLRVVIRHHIGEVGKMLGGLNPVWITLRTVSSAERKSRLA